MHYLVTGGAGYIGSHLVRALLQNGDTATILDNFSTGHRWATQGQEVIEVDLRDLNALHETLDGRVFAGVFHFAAKSLVGESNQQPLLYYQNNVGGTANLLEVCLKNNWTRLVFSSTAAVYGNPITEQITEEHPTQPINVYGQTKLAMEQMLRDVCNSSSLSAVCLRYFNAAGAASDASLGEAHEPETHLIPNVLKAALGKGPPLTIFGDDYPTADGTCIRDYIHVEDLASAHLKAMEYLSNINGFDIFNLGIGEGFSVQEVLTECERIVGCAIPHTVGQRREGDPLILVANSRKAQSVLHWNTLHRHLAGIIGSAWRWEQRTGDRGAK